MPAPGVATVAGGNVSPKCFVKLSGGDNQVLQCGAGDAPFGVSQQGTRTPPYSGLADGLAAIAGEEVRVFGIGEICSVITGGAVTEGQRVKPDASGHAVAVAAAGDQYGGVALQASGGAGAEILIRVQTGTN